MLFSWLVLLWSVREVSAELSPIVLRSLCDVALGLNNGNGWLCTGSPSLPASNPCSSWSGIQCDVDSTILEGINANSRGFTGTISPSIGNFSNLRVLILTDNFISGTIPNAIQNLSTLEVLDLSKNRLIGDIFDIPVQNFLPNLRILNLASNNFSHQPLPASIALLSALIKLDISDNYFTSTIPVSYFDRFQRLEELIITDNLLSGKIPSSICGLVANKLKYISLQVPNVVGSTNVNDFECIIECLARSSAVLFYDYNSDPICTEAPTSVPSVLPSTAVPSTQPSFQPSYRPSVAPSDIPTNVPSSEPSASPSSWPTVEPSRRPTQVPTSQPSFIPSQIPSEMPTSTPTYEPSVAPSAVPSVVPSFIPSQSPSGRPTSTPTYEPSFIPSAVPSTVPSFVPSHSPSGRPTSTPTYKPSFIPSAVPSTAPSSPTFVPSFSPTAKPSHNPTTNPTFSPTFSPSAPTSAPSVSPTVTPSASPSTSPSAYPTTIPSKPTWNPTLVPSRVPSFAPSSPTGQPTSQPSMFTTCVIVKMNIDQSIVSRANLQLILPSVIERAIPSICHYKVQVYTPTPHHVCGSNDFTVTPFSSTTSTKSLSAPDEYLQAETVVTFDVVASLRSIDGINDYCELTAIVVHAFKKAFNTTLFSRTLIHEARNSSVNALKTPGAINALGNTSIATVVSGFRLNEQCLSAAPISVLPNDNPSPYTTLEGNYFNFLIFLSLACFCIPLIGSCLCLICKAPRSNNRTLPYNLDERNEIRKKIRHGLGGLSFLSLVGCGIAVQIILLSPSFPLYYATIGIVGADFVTVIINSFIRGAHRNPYAMLMIVSVYVLSSGLSLLSICYSELQYIRIMALGFSLTIRLSDQTENTVSIDRKFRERTKVEEDKELAENNAQSNPQYSKEPPPENADVDPDPAYNFPSGSSIDP